MKLFLKKLLLTLGFFAALIVVYGLLAVLAQRFLFWFGIKEETVIYLGLAMAAFVMLHFVYLFRWENKTYKIAYLEAQTDKRYSFKRDFTATLKSKENIVHTLAYITLDVIQSAPVGIGMGVGIWRVIFGTIMAITAPTVVFSLTNTIIWCMVHKRWHKSRFNSISATEVPL